MEIGPGVEAWQRSEREISTPIYLKRLTDLKNFVPQVADYLIAVHLESRI